MTGEPLESGTRTEFEAIGVGGVTLFEGALELRDTIERRLGAGVAACFGLPQPNAYGDMLDWYAPEPGPVTPWAKLSDEQRAMVLKHVEALRGQVANLSRELVREGKRHEQTFARLLEHATTIPGDSHIFLVGERPVLTFWGFRRARNSGTLAAAGGRLLGRGNDHKEKTTEFIPPPPRDTPNRFGVALRLWWWLPVVLLILTLIAGIVWRELVQPPPAEQSDNPLAPKRPDITVETPAEPLVFPPEAIATRSMSFLTGRWQASSDALVDSDSRRPISLAYELDQGVGEVVITEQTGSVCRAPVDAAFDGEALTLTPRGEIRCPHRAPFYGVTVTCRPSTDRRALCTGRFPNGKTFRVALGRPQ